MMAAIKGVEGKKLNLHECSQLAKTSKWGILAMLMCFTMC